MKALRSAAFGAAVFAVVGAGVAQAQVVNDVAYQANTFPANDDGSTGAIGLGFAHSLDFFGTMFSQVYLNNNGNITIGSGYGSFTPSGLTAGIGLPVIAPFWADVDTRFAGSAVTYGASTLDGHASYGFDWLNVPGFGLNTSLRDNFQLILIDRSDVGTGDFDFEFNYGSMAWDLGTASEGHCPHIGWNNGNGDSPASYELPGSGVCGAYVNGGGDALNGTTELFEVRNGDVAPPVSGTPEPASLALLATGLVAVGGMVRRKRVRAAE